MTGDGGEQVLDVTRRRRVVGSHTSDGSPRGPVPGLAEPLFDCVLNGVVQLVPTAGEEFDAVVRHRIVRGREHDA